MTECQKFLNSTTMISKQVGTVPNKSEVRRYPIKSVICGYFADIMSLDDIQKSHTYLLLGSFTDKINI